MKQHIPPHNLDAEQAVLGGLMVDPYAWDQVNLHIQAEDEFYKVAHQKIFCAIREMNYRNQQVDILTVSNYLADRKEIEMVGGSAYLAEIINQTPTAMNIGSYAKIVHEKAILRRMILMGGEIIEKSYNESYEDVEKFLDEVEGKIFAIAEKKQQTGPIGANRLIQMSIKRLTDLATNTREFTGVPSGFKKLDGMTSGFQPGELIILAARPSMGKTAFSLNLVQNMALREKKSVAYFSVEMGSDAIIMRLLASEARVNLSDIRGGKVNDAAWPRLIDKAAKIGESKIFIDDTSGISPFEIRTRARRLKAEHGLDIIMIDYLQLMDLKQKVESRERAISEISKTLKAVAKELQVPVIALAQLNRGVEGRTDKRPMLSDLRESGSIEQDADLIMMLYREDYYTRDQKEATNITEVIVGKHRNGPTGTVELKWEPSIGRFVDLEEGGGGSHPLGPPPQPNNAIPMGKPRNVAPGAGN